MKRRELGELDGSCGKCATQGMPLCAAHAPFRERARELRNLPDTDLRVRTVKSHFAPATRSRRDLIPRAAILRTSKRRRRVGVRAA